MLTPNGYTGSFKKKKRGLESSFFFLIGKHSNIYPNFTLSIPIPFYTFTSTSIMWNVNLDRFELCFWVAHINFLGGTMEPHRSPQLQIERNNKQLSSGEVLCFVMYNYIEFKFMKKKRGANAPLFFFANIRYLLFQIWKDQTSVNIRP